MSQKVSNKKSKKLAEISSDLIKNLQQVAAFEKMGDFKRAIHFAEGLLTQYKHHPIIHQYLGVLYLRVHQPGEALKHLSEAIKKNPAEIMLYNYAGIANCQLGHFEKGIYFYRETLKRNPQSGETCLNLAIALIEIKKIDEAEQYLRKAIQLNFITDAVYYNLGLILHQQEKLDDAIIYYEKTLDVNPAHMKCAKNLKDIFKKMKNDGKVVNVLKHILHYEPDSSETHFEIATIGYLLKDYKLAAKHFAMAKDKPTESLSLAYIKSLTELKDYQSAWAVNRKSIDAFPENVDLLTSMIDICKNSCIWDELDAFIAQLCVLIQNDTPYNHGFYVILGYTLEQKLAFAKKVAHFYEKKVEPFKDQCNFEFKQYSGRKIRIGYVSGDIYNHPAAHLMMSMFSHHNRDQFEVYLYSTGPMDKSIYSERIPTTVDHFFDFYEQSGEISAKKIYQDNIDILIDASGYHRNSPAEIFALKPAPLQISFLGYCGTTGAKWMDYFITDNTVVSMDESCFYTEKFMTMPHTYFVTDDRQEVAPVMTRQELGLPEDKFIFCCFNNHIKYESKTFDSWMRILKQVPDSVLLLWLDNYDFAVKNLQKEAEKRDIHKDRIISVSRLAKAEHLARLQLTDLFLDCIVCNAHTTAIDALWAGVPLITCYGHSIASRGASSILKAMDLPELITQTTDEFEEKAIYYATHPEALKHIREKIAAHKKTQPLFNTQLFVKNLEKGFHKAWELHTQNKSPEHISIADL